MRWRVMMACLLWGLALWIVLPPWLGAQMTGDTGMTHIVTDQLQTEPLGQPDPSMPHVGFSVAEQAFDLEVATTPELMERGLMYRTELAADKGMLFPLVPRRRIGFWMKNTLIPLDMLFIRDRKVVQIVHSAPPCEADPCAVYKAEQPVDMVVELQAGTAKRLGLEYGMPVVLGALSKSSAQAAPPNVHSPNASK